MRRGLAKIYDEAEGAPYGIAPRVYCAANPLRYTDPTGMGWIKNLETLDVIWNDDATNDASTPDGFAFIGNNNDDILKHFGVSQPLIRESGKKTSFHCERSGFFFAFIGTTTFWSCNMRYSPDVRTSNTYISDYNKRGKYFEGITFSASFNQTHKTPDPSYNLSYKGSIYTEYNGKEYYYSLTLDTNSFNNPGEYSQTATIHISSYQLKSINGFIIKSIGLGARNQEVFSTGPIVIELNHKLKIK